MGTMIAAPLFAVALLLLVARCASQPGVAGDRCTLPNGAFACGAINARGQAAIIECVNGVFVKIDDCDNVPNTSCQMINGRPFCVAANSNANAGAKAAPVPPMKTVSPGRKATLAPTTKGASNASAPSTANPLFCLATNTPTSASRTPPPTTKPAATQGTQPTAATGNVPGAACRNPAGTFLCGANNKAGQATIVQCVGGTLIKIDDCNDVPHTACRLINGLPFCV